MCTVGRADERAALQESLTAEQQMAQKKEFVRSTLILQKRPIRHIDTEGVLMLSVVSAYYVQVMVSGGPQ